MRIAFVRQAVWLGMVCSSWDQEGLAPFWYRGTVDEEPIL